MLVSFSAHAKITGIGQNYPSTIRSPRALGMGNAFTAMPGSDSTAQYYNPAAINDFDDERRYSVGFPSVDFHPGFVNIVSDLLDLRDDLHSSKSSSEKIDVFRNFTQSHIGEFDEFSTSMPLFQVMNKYYSVGLVVDDQTTISLRDQSFTNFEFKTGTSIGVVGGSAYSFFDDSLQVGGNLKLLYRMGIENQITTADILIFPIKSLIGFGAWHKGIGAGVDLGTKYKLPILEDTLKPTISATIQDVGNTRFTGGAPELPMSISAGAGVFPSIGDVDFAVLADFREINQQMETISKFHFGVEAKFPEIEKIRTRFSLRAGCNQGYIATGFSAQWPLVTLHFAFYGDETGKYTSSKAVYRYAALLTFDF